MKIKGQIKTGIKPIKIPEVISDRTGMYVAKYDENNWITEVQFCDQNIPNQMMRGGSDYYPGYNLTKIELIGDIKRIGTSAFNGCSKITSFPDLNGVEYIYNYAFNNCDSVETLSIPESVKYLGDRAFGDCASLKKVSIYSTSIADLEEYKYPFHNCNALTNVYLDPKIKYIPSRLLGYTGLTSINIPTHINSIGINAFYGCGKATEITIPNSVTLIDAGAFGETGVVEIVIPEQVTKLGNQAFYKCKSLKSITLNSNLIPDYTSYSYPFSGCENLETINFAANVTRIPGLMFYNTGIKKIIIPNTMRELGYNAFSTSSKATEVEINEGVTKIGVKCFYDNTLLEKVTLPETLTSIGSNAFYRCGIDSENGIELTLNNGEIWNGTKDHPFTQAKISNIIFGNNANVVGPYTFAGSNITNLHIPSTVNKLSNNAFTSATINSLTFDEGITEIGSDCFYGVTSLTSVSFPASLTNISANAFRGCSNITTISIRGKEIPENAPWGAVNATIELLGSSDDITIDESGIITAVNEKYSTGDVVIPSAVIVNGEPIDVKGLSDDLYVNNNNITSIKLPESIESLNAVTFTGCNALNAMVIKNDSLDTTSLNESFFNGLTNLQKISYPTYYYVRTGEGYERYLNGVCDLDFRTSAIIDDKLQDSVGVYDARLVAGTINRNETDGLTFDGVNRFKMAAPCYKNSNFGTYIIRTKNVGETVVNDSDWYDCITVFGAELNGAQRDFAIVINKNKYFSLGYGQSNLVASDVLADENEHEIALVYDANQFKFFVDGVHKFTRSGSTSGTIPTEFGIGWNAYSNNTTLRSGSISRIKVFNRALSDDEVLEEYTTHI